MTTPNVLAAVPLLHVEEMRAALAFYCGNLGFEKVSEYRPHPEADDPAYVVLRRDEAVLHLSSFSGDGLPGSVVAILVRDVDALHRELAEGGVAIDLPPTDQTWGNREMYLRDPYGNQLRYLQPLGR